MKRAGLDRRRFLGALAATSAATTFGGACGAPGGFFGDHVPDGDLIDPGMALGHRLRDDHALTDNAPPPATDAAVLDVAIIGAGVAGLSAAWRLRAAGLQAVEAFEVADVAGGTARSGQSSVSAYPWGAHYVTAPLKDDTLMVRVLGEMGALDGTDELGHPELQETFAVREPEERLWVDGTFFQGLVPDALLEAHDRRDLTAFFELMDHYGDLRDGAGRPAFALPRALCSTDASLLALDRITFREFLVQAGFSSSVLLWLCDYAVRDDYGVGVDDVSAWIGLFYFCSRRRSGVGERSVITSASGNGALVQHLQSKAKLTVHTNGAVVDVTDRGDVVDVVVVDAAGVRKTVQARHAIVCTPRFIAGRIIRSLREAPPAWLSSFQTSPWVVANVHLEGRPRADGQKVSLAWDTVFSESRSLGYVTATHQSGRDHGPTVLTWYQPLTDVDPVAARKNLYSTDRAAWARLCLDDLATVHPDIYDLATRVDVCRWGHAMVRPTPGLIHSGVLDLAAAPIGRVHVAHSDLSGMALFEEALFHGTRAAEAVLQARGIALPSWIDRPAGSRV